MTKKKTPALEKLDFPLFDGLAAADRKDYEWFKNLEPERQQRFSAYMMLQWMATGRSNSARQLRTVNYYANPGMLDPVFNGGEHSLLQWQMLCAAGLGQRQFHQWIPELKKAIREVDPEATVKLKDFQDYYSKVYSGASADDILEISTVSLAEFKRKQRLRRCYPQMKLCDIELLSTVVTDQELDERDQQSGE